MKRKIIVLVMFLWCVSSTLALAAQNPFVSGNKKTRQSESKARKYPQFLHPILSKITAWQRTLKRQLTKFGKEIREHPYSSSFWLFLLFSFTYGVIHALGPGHGKSIVVSYFLNRPGKYFHGVLMGNMLTFVHVFSAVTIVLFVRFALNMAGGTSFETASRNLEKISYALLIFLGLLLLGRCMYEIKRGTLDTLNDDPETFEIKPLLVTAFVTGLVPCPGAALILIFTITQHILFAGLLAMVCVAVGMGATTTLFALFAIASRHTLFRLTALHPKLFTLSHVFLSVSGALGITSIGILLLMGSE
jgi:ABC-type nickel/cobalt efflux system permease component RcnA